MGQSDPTLYTANERWIQEQEHELWPDRPLAEFGHKDCRVCGPGPLRRGQVPSQWPHVFYKVDLRRETDGYGGVFIHEYRRKCVPSDATIVSSEVEGQKQHTVMIDLDLPARLVESSTRGHHHLYIDKLMTWRQYRRLLRALTKAGLIEKGYYKASVRRKATHLRPPWRDKADG